LTPQYRTYQDYHRGHGHDRVRVHVHARHDDGDDGGDREGWLRYDNVHSLLVGTVQIGKKAKVAAGHIDDDLSIRQHHLIANHRKRTELQLTSGKTGPIVVYSQDYSSLIPNHHSHSYFPRRRCTPLKLHIDAIITSLIVRRFSSILLLTHFNRHYEHRNPLINHSSAIL
jgi:hypothetical protein